MDNDEQPMGKTVEVEVCTSLICLATMARPSPERPDRLQSVERL